MMPCFNRWLGWIDVEEGHYPCVVVAKKCKKGGKYRPIPLLSTRRCLLGVFDFLGGEKEKTCEAGPSLTT